MGIYLNPGNENFIEIAGMEYYVDKSMLLDITGNHVPHTMNIK